MHLFKAGGITRLSFKVFGLYILLTLAAVVFVAPFVDYACRRGNVVNFGAILLPVALFIGACLIALSGELRKLQWLERHFVLVALVLFVILVAAQLYVVCSAWFTSGWDVRTVTQVENGGAMSEWMAGYLSVYPNQQFLVGLFDKIARVGALLGVSSYLSLVGGSCLCVSTSILLVTFACRCLMGSYKATVFQVFASLFLGMNAWILVPYSDTYGMFFTCAALFCYVVPRSKFVRALGTVFFAMLGYMVKPTAIFILFAVVLVGVLPRVFGMLKGLAQGRNCERAMLYQIGKGALACGLGLILAFGASTFVKGGTAEITPGLSRGMTHFLMMGVNPERKGVWSAQDNELSESLKDPEERTRAQLEVWWDRVTEAGPLGLAKLYFMKNLTVYADGTFAWLFEGTFFEDVIGGSDAVKSFYGIGDAPTSLYHGAGYEWLCHATWICVLAGCVLSMRRRSKGPDEKEPEVEGAEASHDGVFAVVAVTLILLSGFLLIFECRARYLFLYSPYFVLLAVDGLLGIDWRGLLRAAVLPQAELRPGDMQTMPGGVRAELPDAGCE